MLAGEECLLDDLGAGCGDGAEGVVCLELIQGDIEGILNVQEVEVL